MPSSYVSNHVHIVFSTKERQRVIDANLQPKLWAYIAGIARNHDMHAIAVGGTEDHVHILVSVAPTLSISKAAQLLKANSSRWVNETHQDRFEWQEGYFGCSESRSQIPTLRALYCQPA
jgi:putative transposase